MEIHVHNITPFWDESYKKLDYQTEPFNNPSDTEHWLALGFSNKFTGAMCDMRKPQPQWNNKFIQIFEGLGWSNVTTSYYRMSPGTILPVHSDTYNRYVQLYDLHGKETSVHRAIVFLEDWQSGHYLEVDEVPITNWRAGNIVSWQYNTPHLAANMGVTNRYTLQITGHKK